MDKIIDIFQFTNFRKYLDEYQAARVQTDPDFTRAGACALLGLPKTRSYYNDIVKGKKTFQSYDSQVCGSAGPEQKGGQVF